MRFDKAAALKRIFDGRLSEDMYEDPSRMCNRIESLINPINDIFMIRAEPVFDQEDKCFYFDLFLEVYILKRAKTIGLIEGISIDDDVIRLNIRSQERYSVILNIEKRSWQTVR